MSKSILLVDDEPEVLKTLTFRLGAAGFRVKCASAGKEAVHLFIQSFYENAFDVVLLDIKLPDIDGCEILKMIRQEEELRGVAYGEGVIVIMQTALKEPWMDAFTGGCDDYIIKPYAFQDLLKKIEDKMRAKDQRD